MSLPRAPLPRARLGVNIDHVATIRNARGGMHPQPARAAAMDLTATGRVALEVYRAAM